MTIRRDHIAGGVLILFGAAVLTFGWHLPFGTAASPGPGMLPFLVIGLMMALALLLLLQAGSSPPIATVEWTDLPHALRVMAVTVVADGLPVNFHYAESMPNQYSDLVLASMLLGACTLADPACEFLPGHNLESLDELSRVLEE